MSFETQEVSKNTSPHIGADLFTGTVVSCDPATMVVVIAPDGPRNLNQVQGISLSATYSAALGFVETMLPGVGTRVLCQSSGGSTLIIGAIPDPEAMGEAQSSALPNKAILGSREPVFNSVHRNDYLSAITKSCVYNSNSPTDVLQGEKVISNEFGVMLGLFKLLATLKASELAQIQCFFLDDLVRIISHNFQHFTSLGELKVFHDGKGIHLEMGATHIPSESIGQAVDSPNSNITETNTNTPSAQFFQMADDQLNMLERMKLFVGKLGEFANFMIIRPAPKAMHSLNGLPPVQPDTGLLQIKASLDGTLIVRSVNGIYLEKTNWIRVPQRIRTPEDPQGDDGTTIQYDQKPSFNFNNNYSYREIATLYYLQLRDYLSYINEAAGYANFKKQVLDYYVNDDKTKEVVIDSKAVGQIWVDPDTGARFTMNRSCVALMPNGGVSLSDAWGSALVMEGGNIYIQPAKDLVMQPNRHLIAKVGGNVGIAARKGLDLSSTEAGMRIKTNEAQHLYSSTGEILIQSDGPAFSGNIVTYPNSGAVRMVSGVVLHAPNSGVNAYGNQVYLDGTLVNIKGEQITLESNLALNLLSNQTTVIEANQIWLLSEMTTINYSEGTNSVMGLGSTVVGLKGQEIGYADIPLVGPCPVYGLYDPNSKDKNTRDFFTKLKATTDQYENFKISDYLTSFKKDTDFTSIKFEFLPSSMYNIGPSDIIPQTLSQQTEVITGPTFLQTWQEQAINNSYPYPGSDQANSYVTVACNNISNIDLANKVTDLVTGSKQPTMAVSNIFKQYKSM